MGILDKIPKFFWICLSIICIFSIVILAVIVALNESNNSKEDNGQSNARPLFPSNEKPQLVFQDGTQLGIYFKAGVATDGKPCAKIATDVMKRNGSVVDAAVAGLFCNGVYHPQSMGIGGGFIMTIYIKKERKSYSLMSREVAPINATQDMYKNKPEESRFGAKSIAVPGEVLGYYEAKQRFGNPDISWKSLIEPSIKLCEEGTPMSDSISGISGKTFQQILDNPELSKIFINPKTKQFYKTGTKFKNPKLAETLRRIAQNGADEIYGEYGETGKKLVKDIQEAGGIISHEDLLNYKVRWENPISTDLNGGEFLIHTTPPPSSGAVLTGILKILDQYQLNATDANKVITYHRFIESCKFGFAERTKIGDIRPDDDNEQMRNAKNKLNKVLNDVISSEWAANIKKSIQDDKTNQDPTFYGAELSSTVEDEGTAHLSFLAPNGDAVAVTSTINSYFGSKIISKSTGIVLNNEMDDFSTPGFANVYGIEPSPANYIKPGRRPVSSMVPTIFTDSKTGQVRLIVGAAGGPKIITSTAFVSMLNLWLGKDIKDAISTKRLHHQLLPMHVTHDIGVKQEILEYLSSVGHKLVQLAPGRRGSVAQGVAVKSQIITANNDYRKDGGIDGF